MSYEPDENIYHPEPMPYDGKPSGVEFVEAWVCDQPPYGARYKVIRDEWFEREPPLRVIYEIQITGVESVDR